MRDAVGMAPRERMLIEFAAVALCAAGLGLLGVAGFHALDRMIGAQGARVVSGVCVIALACMVWAVGAVRARRRQRRAEAARAQLAQEARKAAFSQPALTGPCAAFVLAFLMGRKN